MFGHAQVAQRSTEAVPAIAGRPVFVIVWESSGGAYAPW